MENTSTTTTVLDNKAILPKRNKWKRKLYLLLFLVVLACVFYFLFLRPYSEGYRDGYVTKLSKKGFVFKTWEGELIRNQFSAATDKDLFKFSISEDGIARQLNNIDQRQYVKLHYKEYMFNIFFKGETKYFIDEVKILPAPQDVNLLPQIQAQQQQTVPAK